MSQSAFLSEAPDSPEKWNIWSEHHRISHNEIRQAIRAQKGLDLPDYPIDPIRQESIGDFLQYNGQLHSDMDGALGLQGVDLLDVDFKDRAQRLSWIAAHWQEHRDAEDALGI